MIYEKQTDLLDLKKRARITNREIAAALGCSPSAAGAKLTGFVALFPKDRRIIETLCREIIGRPGARQQKREHQTAFNK
jgi:hypothetical protein